MTNSPQSVDAWTNTDHWLNTTLVPFTSEGITSTTMKNHPLAYVLAYLSGHEKKDLCEEIKTLAGKLHSACAQHDVDWSSTKAFNDSIKQLQPSIADPIKQLRITLRERKTALPNASFAITLKTNAKGFGKRKDANIAAFTGVTQVDFDHVNIDDIDQAVTKLETHISTIAVFVSPSGDGIKVIARIPTLEVTDPESAAKYKEYHRKISFHMADFANLPESCVDTTINDLSRACFIPFHADCKVNPDAEVMDLDSLPDVQGTKVAAETLEKLGHLGGVTDERGAIGGGEGERQEGYRTVDEFRALILRYADITLSDPPQKSEKLPDGSTLMGWNVPCPAKHKTGDASKSMLFFNEGANLRFPAGYKCFSDDCEGHGYKWFATQYKIPGQSALDNAVTKFNVDHSFTMLGGEGAVIASRISPETMRIGAEDTSGRINTIEWKFPKVTDAKMLYANLKVDTMVKRGKKWDLEKKPLFDKWMEHPERKTHAQGIVCDPSGREYSETLNVFPGWGVAPKQGDWHLMQEHIRTIICAGDEKLYEWLLNWAAWPICNPYIYPSDIVGDHNMQTTVAPVLQGPEGCGKGTFVQWILSMYGPSGITIATPKQLLGDFSGHLIDKTMTFADEALFAGDPRIVDEMKGRITEDSILINAKFKTAFSIKTGMNYIMASNNDWVVNVTENNRRYCVLEVLGDRIKDDAYFEAIAKERRNGGVAAMMYDLIQRNPGWRSVVNFPVTAGTRNQQALSCSISDFWRHVATEERDVLQMLVPMCWDQSACVANDKGEYPAPEFDLSAWPLGVNRKNLYQTYEQFCKEFRAVPKGSPKVVKFRAFNEKCMAMFGDEMFPKEAIKINGQRYGRGAIFPSREKIQRATAEFLSK